MASGRWKLRVLKQGASGHGVLSISGEPTTVTQVGQVYSFTPVVSGGAAPYTFTLYSGTLPSGLSLNASTGAVTGTPTTAATYPNIGIRVTDSENTPVSADLAPFSVLVNETPSSTFPATQTIPFGAKTLTGYGAHLMGYTGDGTISITSQKDASNADVTIFQIGQNALSWKGASANYGTAPPASLNGPYTVVVTDGSYSSTITVNVIADAYHAREMAATATGGRWVGTSGSATGTPGAAYRLDGTGSTALHQLRNILALASASGGPVKGDNIYCRDGILDPSETGIRMYPRASYTGTGVITIRSDTVDTSDDEFGMPNRMHGFRIRSISWSASSSGDVAIPVEFRDVWFEPNLPTSKSGCKYATDSSFGVSYYNCRVSPGTGATLTYNIGGLYVRGNPTTVAYAKYCTVTGIGKGIIVDAHAGIDVAQATTGALVQWNDGSYINEDFINDTGIGSVIKDNFARDFVRLDLTDHSDFIQNTTDFATPLVGPTIRRNICIMNSDLSQGYAQGIFVRGLARTLTDVVVQNNIVDTLSSNGVYIGSCDDAVVQFNTAESLVIATQIVLATGTIVATPSKVQAIVPSGDVGTGGTFNYNTANSVDWSTQGGVTITTPNATLTYNADRTVMRTGYDAAYAAYTETGIYTRAQALAARTPITGGALMNPDGTYNGAVGPDGDWNTGAVY